MELAQQLELQRAIAGPVSASIQTRNHSSFLVIDDALPSDDSDEDDLDRYIDVGLREQLFITLSRAIHSTQDAEQKITESSVPDSIKKNKRSTKNDSNRSKQSTKPKPNHNHNNKKKKKSRHFKQTHTLPTLPIEWQPPTGASRHPIRYTISHPPPVNRNRNININRNRTAQKPFMSPPLSPTILTIKPPHTRRFTAIPPPPSTPPPPVPSTKTKRYMRANGHQTKNRRQMRYTQYMRPRELPPLIKSKTATLTPTTPTQTYNHSHIGPPASIIRKKSVPQKALPPLSIRSRHCKQTASTNSIPSMSAICTRTRTRARARSRSKDDIHDGDMVLHSIQHEVYKPYEPQTTETHQVISIGNVPLKIDPTNGKKLTSSSSAKSIPLPPQLSISSSSRTTITTQSSLSSHSLNSIDHKKGSTDSWNSYSSHDSNSIPFTQTTRNRNATVAVFPTHPLLPSTITSSTPNNDPFVPPAPSFVGSTNQYSRSKGKQATKKHVHRPEAPMQVYSHLPMRSNLDTIDVKSIPLHSESEAEPPPLVPFKIKIDTQSDEKDTHDTDTSDIPFTLPDYLSASALLLSDPTLDPKRDMKHELNPLQHIRPRGATWIGNINTSPSLSPVSMATGLSPSTTAPALDTRLDRNDSLVAGFQEATMEDGHIVLKKHDSKTHFDDVEKQMNKQFKNGFPDFVRLHQRFSQEFANKIFNAQLKSYQRAFMPISPQHLGLLDFSNIRSRRRALFGGDKLAHKPFTDGDTSSTMHITDEERDEAIARFMNPKHRLKKLVRVHPLLSTQSTWQKLLGKVRNRQPKKTAFALDVDSPVNMTNNCIYNIDNNSIYTMRTDTTEDDTVMQSNWDIMKMNDNAMYKSEFEINQITDSIHSNQLKRGDLIFIIGHQHIDVESLNLNSFVTKYKISNFLRRMGEEQKDRVQQMKMIRQRRSTPNEAMDDIQMLQELQSMGTAKHCMIVLQNIGSSVEIAHVTSHGGMRSFIKEFNAERIAHTLYFKEKNIKTPFRTTRSTSTNIVSALGRGPPVAYRCVVYRLSADVLHNRTFANEAANVAENLVKGGRVLSDPAVFRAGHLHTRHIETENPEKSFYRFLLNSDSSLFRRAMRSQFDEGTNFFNFSSSEFVALCYQRALVNKRSFDRELIRLLDICPQLTPPPLLQKYFHLNIDEHGDWKCLGNVFFSYL